MDGIALMIDEHKNIKRMLEVMRKACLGIMNGKEIDYRDFESMIDFVRNYADKHHHGKEEKILFNRMVNEIGGAAEKLVNFGMLVEHDFGRLYMKDLEEALSKVKAGDNEAKLDVIANAVSYTNLLSRHIEKEDNVAYPFAKRGLSEETLNKVNIECDSFEEEMKKGEVQDKYIRLLEGLEQKYRGFI
jgi:hemerythrin-like domain-containing protein